MPVGLTGGPDAGAAVCVGLRGWRTTVVVLNSSWLWLAGEAYHLGWKMFPVRPQEARLLTYLMFSTSA